MNAATTYLIGCNISDNSAKGVCGGIYNFDKEDDGVNPTHLFIYNSTVARNATSSSWGGGGGAYLRESSHTQIVNSTFYDNNGGVGGAIRVYADSGKETYVDILSSTFYKNSAIGKGGGIETQPSTTVKIHNSVITGNTASNGADVLLSDNTTTFSYVTLGDKILDKDGNEVDGQTFDHTSMISSMATNGTCMITGSSPAATLGMNSTLLQSLGNSLIPPVNNDIITKDQLGVSRSGKTVMGAVVPN